MSDFFAQNSDRSKEHPTYGDLYPFARSAPQNAIDRAQDRAPFPEAVEQYFDDALQCARMRRLTWPAILSRAARYDCEQTLFAYIQNGRMFHKNKSSILENLQFQKKSVEFFTQLKFIGAALKRVKSGLDEAQIPFIVLKGASLGHALYGAAVARPTTDIDIWLRPCDLERARARIFGLGYRQTQKPRSWATNQEIFEHDVFVPVELHWHPALPSLSAPGFDDAYRRAVPDDVLAAHAHTPDIRDMWYLLLTHALEHTFALKTRLDIIAFCSNFIQKRYVETDESVLHEHVAQYGLGRISRLSFDFTRRILEDFDDSYRNSCVYRILYKNMCDLWIKNKSIAAQLVSGRDDKSEAFAGLALRSAMMMSLDSRRDGVYNAMKTFFFGPHRLGHILHDIFASRFNTA